MKGIFPIDKFRTLQTPFYYYDTKVLRDTLSAINHEVAKYPNYSVHYAVKANANPKVLTIIRESGMGADCVSGGEIRAAIRAGFPACCNKISNHTEYHSVPKPYPRISALLHNSPFANRPVPRRHRLLPNWDG